MAAERAHTDDRLRGQLEWLADEIDAQRPFIRQLPEPQLTAAPLEGEPSVRGLYERLLRAARDRHLPALADMADRSVDTGPAPQDLESVDDVLDAIVQARQTLLDLLDDMEADAWDAAVPNTEGTPLRSYLHAIALEDGEVLRTVGERFYESDLRFSRGTSSDRSSDQSAGSDSTPPANVTE